MNAEYLRGKTVLITGGTGSFGQQFTETLFNDTPAKKIIIFSRDEFKQHEMRTRLKDSKDRLRFFLGDVRDLSRLERAFAGVDIVVHAAALKQVPALEFNPLEAVKTNIIGTQNVIDAALDNGVGKVLLVSTDKAVNPINLYGATKLCAEKLLIAANAYRRTTRTPPSFSVVRYGNVIGSRGSFLEVLQEQKKTGVVTLTHKDMTRFWITLSQAASLVLFALAHMRGGEIFVPKLSAMKIADLLSTHAPECEVKIIGVRPGEKLHEMLMSQDEARRAWELSNCYVIEPTHEWWDGTHLRKNKKVPEDFNYASNKVSQLKEIKVPDFE
ncbi:MAG: polysaccharide biosynthesis protein CapD [Parcubacteria group bacterium Greene0416_79]|nr:MAG: polysaccharide biosynthesis protein CapD [Parcubacteria group bacterium Greene0416_79]